MNPRFFPEQSILGKDLVETERAVEIECIPDGEHSFTFFSQIVTQWINSTFLLVNKIKMIGMLLIVMHSQVHKNI